MGQTALEDGRFREAHSNLGLVLALDKDYKDASALHQEALETGRFNVAISDFDSRNRDRDVALELRSGVQRGLLDSSDPFVGVVDRTLREDILAEQELSLSGMSDETVTVGEIAGARAILTGAVLTYSSKDRIAVEHEPQRDTASTSARSRTTRAKSRRWPHSPWPATTCTQRRSVFLKFEIKLISTETGEVLLSEVEQVHAQDAVEYAVSQVTAGSLYLARANGEVDRSGKSRMNALLGARRQLATESASAPR